MSTSFKPVAAKGAPAANSLRRLIEEEIARKGPIPFSRYMELCLYEPELGYYSHPREQFGKAGDFYTSSDVHAVFGRLLARQFEEMWRLLGSPARVDLIELGPGRGLFASDVLDWSAKKFPQFFRALHYTAVEQSLGLRSRLADRIAAYIASGRASAHRSLETAVSAASEAVIVFGNEFFDALPVEIVDHRGSVRVGVDLIPTLSATEADKGGAPAKFVESFVPPSAGELDYLDRYSVHPEEGERVEVAFGALGWMNRIAAIFEQRRGFAVLVDYGYTREQQLAGRHRDTIMTYRQHRANPSPYESPGEQDITAHVNFTALQARAAEHGLEPFGLVTQSQFLLGVGEATEFADAFEECKLPQERAKVALQLRHLISPEEMGETFQVLVLGQGVRAGEAAQLCGLKWAPSS